MLFPPDYREGVSFSESRREKRKKEMKEEEEEEEEACDWSSVVRRLLTEPLASWLVSQYFKK